MTCWPGAACALALLPGLIAAGGCDAACLTLDSYPERAPLAQVAVTDNDATFTVGYVHSVTRTPVTERYRVDGDTLVETEIRFPQHGPGLPTEPDAGETFERRDGEFVVTMARRFPVIVMRVHRDQAPTLRIGGRAQDLAVWGNRAIALSAGPCRAPVP